jgi:hypothetical protein
VNKQKINFNQKVSIKITDEEKLISIYREHMERLFEWEPSKVPEYIENFKKYHIKDGYLEIQLWQFMFYFGGELYNGANPPFDINAEIWGEPL